MTTEADSGLLWVTPADAVRLGHGEEREDRKNDEGRIISEDVEGGLVKVESCDKGQQ